MVLFVVIFICSEKRQTRCMETSIGDVENHRLLVKRPDHFLRHPKQKTVSPSDFGIERLNEEHCLLFETLEPI